MEKRSIYKNLSPLDHRYYVANREAFDKIGDILSEEASIKYCVEVEAALVKTYIDLFMDGNKELKEAAAKLPELVLPDEVYEEEEKTQHNIRALVNVIKRHLPEEIKHFVHMGATSVDVLDTAQSMKIRDVTRMVVIPYLLDLLEKLVEIADKEAETPQVGRTHGQHAVPITLGFAISEYVARLGKSIIRLEELSKDVKGKLAGAVGAYNATSLIVKDPIALEKAYLGHLGLEPSEHSTQLVEPEHQLRLLLEMNVAFGVIANLADDLRNLQRSEISELRELFTSTQVGSSTMPQKRNPWNSEHVKSLWKAFAPRVMTFYMDQISEHQRDLTNSASLRFVSDYVAGFVAAIKRMIKVVSTLYVDTENLNKNISAGDFVLAEAMYILLSIGGEADAHEKIRVVTLKCEKEGKSLVQALKDDTAVWSIIDEKLQASVGIGAEEFFSNSANYRGQAAVKAKSLAAKYSGVIKEMRDTLK